MYQKINVQQSKFENLKGFTFAALLGQFGFFIVIFVVLVFLYVPFIESAAGERFLKLEKLQAFCN